MTREEIISGLQFTIDMFLFDPRTGETHTEPRNDMDKTTIDACRSAIKKLKDNSYELWKESYEVEHQKNIRLEEKIKALEQEPCEDAISRKEVLELFAENADAVRPYSQTWEEVKTLPSVTPTRKVGKWIYDKAIQNWRCSECNETPRTLGFVGTADFMAEHFRFCNHCGAEMRESEDEE